MGAAHVACKGDTGFVIVPTLLQFLGMIVVVGMGDIFQVVPMQRPRIGNAPRMLSAHRASLMLPLVLNPSCRTLLKFNLMGVIRHFIRI
jgi:hypothetical protein